MMKICFPVLMLSSENQIYTFLPKLKALVAIWQMLL